MKKRHVDANRLRRMRKMKMSERLSESAYTFLKFMVMWTFILLADFLLEFRLEYLWPCWLFFGSVYTTFHCHGLMICVCFVCAAFTLDVFCLIFVPLHWLFLVASTYVLFHYIWHSEKGVCLSTVSLWLLLVYTEASLRLKDVKPSNANLSHLFAAHCIGYPVVYLGFDATCYFTNVFKLRLQKAVQSDNHFHMHLLQHSLPPSLQGDPKTSTDGGSKWKVKPESSQYQCPNGTLPVDWGGEERMMEKASPPAPFTSAKSAALESKDAPHSPAGGADAPPAPESLPQEEQGRRSTRTPKGSSPKGRQGSTNPPPPPAGRTEKKQRSSSKTISPNRDAAEQAPPSTAPTAPTAPSHHAEQISRLELELRRLKAELQTSRQTEQELRSHVCNLSNSERSLRPEASLLRQANELLHSKLLGLTKNKQRDKHVGALLEKRSRAEVEARQAAEKHLAELQAQTMEEAARNVTNRQELCESHMLKQRVKDLEAELKHLQLESEVTERGVVELEEELEALGEYRGVETETDLLLSTLSAMRDKAQHLEFNLSAETRIKLDLFSALGDARRQLELASDQVVNQDVEISEMKKKIAEVMAVSPGVSYVSPRTHVPHYLTKLLPSERYVLHPRALLYQCLKK